MVDYSIIEIKSGSWTGLIGCSFYLVQRYFPKLSFCGCRRSHLHKEHRIKCRKMSFRRIQQNRVSRFWTETMSITVTALLTTSTQPRFNDPCSKVEDHWFWQLGVATSSKADLGKTCQERSKAYERGAYCTWALKIGLPYRPEFYVKLCVRKEF